MAASETRWLLLIVQTVVCHKMVENKPWEVVPGAHPSLPPCLPRGQGKGKGREGKEREGKGRKGKGRPNIGIDQSHEHALYMTACLVHLTLYSEIGREPCKGCNFESDLTQSFQIP